MQARRPPHEGEAGIDQQVLLEKMCESRRLAGEVSNEPAGLREAQPEDKLREWDGGGKFHPSGVCICS
jgi:hypothetical protein